METIQVEAPISDHKLLEKTDFTEPQYVLYTAKDHTTGGRDGGSARSSDGRLEVKFTVPGTPGTGTNPEQMFGAGWSACFIGAMKIAAAKMKVRVPVDVAVDAEV